MILTLLPEGDPSLLLSVPDFDFDNPSHNAEDLARDLVETMTAHDAFGLAANQCGFACRVFVLQPRAEGDPAIVCFNPKVTVLGQNRQTGNEGCLSFPRLVLSVERALMVELEYQSAIGEHRQIILSGLHARGAQHEFDHLNGIVFTEHVSKLKLERAKKKRQKGTR